MPKLTGVTIESCGVKYTYNTEDMTWRVDGKPVYPKTVSNTVKQLREVLLDTANKL